MSLSLPPHDDEYMAENPKILLHEINIWKKEIKLVVMLRNHGKLVNDLTLEWLYLVSVVLVARDFDSPRMLLYVYLRTRELLATRLHKPCQKIRHKLF